MASTQGYHKRGWWPPNQMIGPVFTTVTGCGTASASVAANDHCVAATCHCNTVPDMYWEWELQMA